MLWHDFILETKKYREFKQRFSPNVNSLEHTFETANDLLEWKHERVNRTLKVYRISTE